MSGRRRPPIRSMVSRLLVLIVVLALLFLISGLAYRWAEWTAIDDLRQQMAHRLDLYSTTLEGELGKYDYLPTILPLNEGVIALLHRPDETTLVAAVNRHLEQLNRRARSSAIYILDARGRTVAASNWNEPTSFVGMDLSYRPYFHDARLHGSGRFYGIGTTSGEPGYYFAHAIQSGGQLLGVAAVKVSLDRLEATWAPGPERVFVTDGNGVIILASVAEWKFKTTGTLPAETLARLNAARQYDRATLEPFRFVEQREQAGGTRIVALDDGSPNSSEFLALSKDLPGIGWQITMLSDLKAVRATEMDPGSETGGYARVLLL